MPLRERLREHNTNEASLLSIVDDASFARVERMLMRKHEDELGGPPDETDPASLATHMRFWNSLQPASIDYDNAENVAHNLLCHHAKYRLMQRVQALPAPKREAYAALLSVNI